MGELALSIHAGWRNNEKIGTVFINNVRGKEIYSFEYEHEWLVKNKDLYFDPDIQPFMGRQYLTEGKETYGFLQDISPDRWGRKLLQRKDSNLARNEGRAPYTLMPSDYLLGVQDKLRYGGIRIKLNDNYVDNSLNSPVPPFTRLRELEQAVRSLENNDPNNDEWLNMLIVPGSSLGGARPKANVIDNNGNLWIAKFPSRYDECNIGAWEYIASKLADKCYISTNQVSFIKSGDKDIFLTKRFDRNGDARIHAASAMTLLSLTDGSDEGNYIKIADFIRANCNDVSSNLEELWRRMVFSVAINNTDDHLRNHSFLLQNDNSWSLSRVYDINPNPFKSVSLDIDIGIKKNLMNLFEYAEFFNISQSKAKDYIFFVASTE